MQQILKWTSPHTLIHRITGPIFAKELRISSRRFRNYLLRIAYLVMLILFIVMSWTITLDNTPSGSTSFSTSRMAEVGRYVTTTVIWFQFCAVQLIAIIMLSNSISDEIYHRTLGVLMTTPINSFQIVMGKLLSKLFQLLLLVAISLPLLAVVRVFGGIQWSYLIRSICITFTAVFLAGALSLFFSISGRRSYAVIIKTLFTMGVIFVMIPWTSMIGLALKQQIQIMSYLFSLYLHINPFAALFYETVRALEPNAALAPPGTTIYYFWPLHCLVMLLLALVLLAVSVKIVRRLALRQAVGDLDLTNRKKRKSAKTKSIQPKPTISIPATEKAAPVPAVIESGPIRRVQGNPIVWKELRSPLIQGGKKSAYIGLVFSVLAMVFTYIIGFRSDSFRYGVNHAAYAIVFVLMGLISNVVLSATSITAEKESRSWPILMATPMAEWKILLGKAVGGFRRCLPIWIFMAGHFTFFVVLEYVHPLVLIHMALLVAWSIIFLTGTGMYFSARFKRATTAVVANLILVVVLWVAVPMVFGTLWELDRDSWAEDAFHATSVANPVVQAYVVSYGAGEYRGDWFKTDRLNYRWLDSGLFQKAAPTTMVLVVSLLFYSMLGGLFAWQAKNHFRRHVF